MPKYVIEREVPGVGALSQLELAALSTKSCDVLAELGTEITWLESFVTADKLYCVYLAPSEQLIEEHARKGGFPANRISEVITNISPATADPVLS